MFRFGYDFYNNDKQKVLLPNGVLNQENADGRVFKLYLPPWWGHLLRRINLDFEVRSVEDLSGKELTTKWIYLLEPLGDPYGWLGYEQEWLDSSDQDRKKIIDSLFSGISETALKSVRNDKAIICIWHAQEAPNINHVDINLFEEFHKELKSKDINPSNFVFVNGNLKTKSQYKYWKRNSEYNDQKDIHMIEFSSWRHVDYPKTWNLANFDENKIIKKKFLCFNRNLIHPHRLVLLTMLYERNLLSSGMVSFDKIQKLFISTNYLDNWKLSINGINYPENIGLGPNGMITITTLPGNNTYKIYFESNIIFNYICIFISLSSRLLTFSSNVS